MLPRSFHAVACVLLLSAAAPVRAVEPLETDRPDAAEGAGAVPLGSLQIEAGMTLATDPDFTIGEVLLRYGIVGGVELRLTLPSWHHHQPQWGAASTVIPPPPQPAALRGFGDFGFGGKFELPSPHERIALGVLVGVTLPTGDAPFTEDRVGADIVLAGSYELSPNASLAVNLGAARAGTQTRSIDAVSLGLRHSARWGSYMEWAFEGGGERGSHLLDTGITFLLQPITQLDLRIGLGGGDAEGENHLGFGISRRW